jgi:putative membrane protein
MKKIRNIFFTIAALIMAVPSAVFAGWGCINSGYGPGWHHWYGGGFFNGGIFMLIFNVLLVGLVVFLAVKFLKGGSIPGVNNETPLDILKKRLAKGEITKDEFDDLKKIL